MAIILGGGVLSTYAVEEYVSKRMQETIGRSISTLAFQLQDKLDRWLFERHREISIAASQVSISAKAQPSSIEHWLRSRHQFDDDFSWLALIDTNGRIEAEAGENRSSGDLLQWPSVQVLLQHPERHNAESHFRNIRRGDAGSVTEHLIDMAAPVLDDSGQIHAFILASIDWHWAQAIATSVANNDQDAKGTDAFVLSDQADILLGPPTVGNDLSNLHSIRGARDGQISFALETWPDGIRYLTGFARSDGHRGFRGFGWTVLIRKNAELALLPINDMKRQIWTIASLFALHGLIIAWYLSGEIAAPLLRLSKAADAVRSQELDQEIPVVTNYAEVQSLSKSLISLVSRLKSRELEQADLAASFESQVNDRTAELVLQNASLDEAKRTAEIATHAKSRFLAAASHDLRQPLHALMLFVRVLKRKPKGAEVTDLIENIDSAVSSLSKMFDALLHVSRLDAGVIAARISPVPLRELLNGLSAGYEAEARQRGLRFRCRISGEPIVLADPALLETIVRNLISNAIKFTKTGSILVISRRRSNRLLIEVHDTGPGIVAERQKSVFDEFERDQMQADGPNHGLGLGLSIVHRYAKLMGAEVNLLSRVGRGSRFTVALALHEAESVTLAAVSDQRSVECLDRLCIMLLDDNGQILDAMQQDLSGHGAIVFPFDSVEAADIALRAGLSADLAIVDYDLGGPETGLAFLERTKLSFRKHNMSFILTGRTDTATLETITRSGVPFLIKPIDSAAVAEHLASVAH